MKDDPSRVNAIEVLERFRVSFRANGKREMQVGNFSNLKWAEKSVQNSAAHRWRHKNVTPTETQTNIRHFC